MENTSQDQDDSGILARRALALEEAELVLSSSEYAKCRQTLENFNLLSVCANPHGYRTVPIETKQRPMSTSQPRDDTFLSSITESLTKEIENINSTIQSYSRTYLGNNFLISDESDYLYDMDYYLNWEYDDFDFPSMSSNITTTEIDEFSNVEEYLNRCGPLASKLEESLGQGLHPSLPEEDTTSEQIHPSHLFSIPELFFQEDFQLSDPKTFESLLLRNYSPTQSQRYTTDKDDSSYYPRIALHDLDAYTQYLDTIEVALLHQVRSHAETFFQESDRFYDLKSLVEESIEEVRSLQSQVHTIHTRTVVDIESIPFMDAVRYRMRTLDRVLEDIDNVLDVKSCVGGLVAAGDYLGAVEAVNVAKSLLNGDCPSNTEYRAMNEEGHDELAMSMADPFVLRKINALGRIFEEFSQYENVVVSLMSQCRMNSDHDCYMFLIYSLS